MSLYFYCETIIFSLIKGKNNNFLRFCGLSVTISILAYSEDGTDTDVATYPTHLNHPTTPR